MPDYDDEDQQQCIEPAYDQQSSSSSSSVEPAESQEGWRADGAGGAPQTYAGEAGGAPQTYAGEAGGAPPGYDSGVEGTSPGANSDPECNPSGPNIVQRAWNWWWGTRWGMDEGVPERCLDPASPVPEGGYGPPEPQYDGPSVRQGHAETEEERNEREEREHGPHEHDQDGPEPLERDTGRLWEPKPLKLPEVESE